MNISKLITAILVSALFIWCDIDPFHHSFLHMINFPIHEIGHVLFRPFGQFIYIVGGSLFQILVPIFCTIYFFWRQEKFSSAITTMWIGNNFFDVAVYVRDAVYMEIPLASPFSFNSEGLIHDWNWLLTQTGMLAHSDFVANVFVVFGILISLSGVAAAFYFSRLHTTDQL